MTSHFPSYEPSRSPSADFLIDDCTILPGASERYDGLALELSERRDFQSFCGLNSNTEPWKVASATFSPDKWIELRLANPEARDMPGVRF